MFEVDIIEKGEQFSGLQKIGAKKYLPSFYPYPWNVGIQLDEL